MPKKLTSAELSKLASEALVSLALGKAYYKHQDHLVEALLDATKKRRDLKFAVKVDRAAVKKQLDSALEMICATIDGKTFAIADKFEDRNSIGVGLSARRYELEEVTAP
jgi:hypothetical protein